jgi:hypothetical protein
MSSQNETTGQNALALNAAAAQNSMLQVAGRVTNDDIVAIFVAKHEETMNLQRLQAERSMRNTQAAINAVEENLGKIGPEVLKTINFSEAQVIAAQLNNAGFGAFEAKVSLEGTKTDDKEWNFEISVIKKGDPKKSCDSDSTVVSKEVIVPFTQDAIALVKDLAARQQELSNTQADLISIKKQLSNIPSLMLRARARLAELALSKTAEGQEILANLMGTTALPTSL